MKKTIKYRPSTLKSDEYYKRKERREIIFEIIFYAIICAAGAGVIMLFGGLLK